MIPIPQLSPTAWAIVGGCTLCFVFTSWWAIRDAFSRQFASTNEKLFWVQLAVLVPFLGGILYAVFGRKRGKPAGS